ncbi:hypothetical protein [Agrobacterium tumefaciens]|uniref:hypothetical protein n=1 Tax=Agrobacterium tumefaciens TaxID=358 RepID=UPI0005505238
MTYLAWYKDVSPDAKARVLVKGGDNLQDVKELDVKPAKEAFKEAIEAENASTHSEVSVWVEDVTASLEMPDVKIIYDAWVKEGLA